jgi:long-chain acyl-CoA synthetase
VALGDVELSLPQYRVLNLLAEGKALPSSLADRLNVRRPSITVVVDGLVARGLVARSQDRDDRRRVTHSITDQGKGLLEKADASVDGRLRSIAARLGEEDAEEAIRGLSRWGPAIREWRRQRTSGAGR